MIWTKLTMTEEKQKNNSLFVFILTVVIGLLTPLIIFEIYTLLKTEFEFNRIIGSLEQADFSGYDSYTKEMDNLALEADAIDLYNLSKTGKSFIVFFGFDSCPYCNAALPAINEAFKNSNTLILYVDTRKDPSWKSNVDIDNYNLITELFGDLFPIDEDGVEHLHVPHIMAVKYGQVVADVAGLGELDPTPSEMENDKEKYNEYVKELRTLLDKIKLKSIISLVN